MGVGPMKSITSLFRYRSGHAWRRSRLTAMLVVWALFAGAPLGGPTLHLSAARGQDLEPASAPRSEVETKLPYVLGTTNAESQVAAPMAQAGVIQAADRKGVIWRIEHKWATESGYNWAGIESDLQDMSNAGIGWVRI